MPKLINAPTVIAAGGNPPKEIREYIGRVNTNNDAVSIAHMISPSGWSEPGQRPKFEEYTIVLRGTLRAECEDGTIMSVVAGQAICTQPGEWISYSTPGTEGAEYISVCLPAFSPTTVNRDKDE